MSSDDPPAASRSIARRFAWMARLAEPDADRIPWRPLHGLASWIGVHLDTLFAGDNVEHHLPLPQNRVRASQIAGRLPQGRTQLDLDAECERLLPSRSAPSLDASRRSPSNPR